MKWLGISLAILFLGALVPGVQALPTLHQGDWVTVQNVDVSAQGIGPVYVVQLSRMKMHAAAYAYDFDGGFNLQSLSGVVMTDPQTYAHQLFVDKDSGSCKVEMAHTGQLLVNGQRYIDGDAFIGFFKYCA